jgi:hydrophobic/amphiphilic exporter-1 (mainly G- bacteria), HAE1 family
MAKGKEKNEKGDGCMNFPILFLKKTYFRSGRKSVWKRRFSLFDEKILKGFLLSGLLFQALLASAQASEAKKEIIVLTLDKALQIAVEKNKDIQKAKEYRNLVEGRYVEERAAALPQLVILGGMSRDHDESQRAAYASIPGFAQKIPVERESRSATIGVNQLLYSFGQVEAAIRAAKIGLKTADDQLLLNQQATLKDVSSAFYDVLLSKELNALAEQNLEQKKRHLDEAQKKYLAGTATDYDILAAQVEVENARPEVIRTENLIRITRENLRFLIGLGNNEVDAQGTLLSPIASYPGFEESLVLAWKNRPELSDLKHRIGISEELLNIAKAGNMPVLNFKAGYGWQSLDYLPGQADGPAWTAGFFVTFPFFDGLRTQGKVAQNKSNISSLKIEETKLLDAIVLQTRESVSKVMEAGEIVKGLSGTVEQAQRLLAMAEKGYEFGVKTKLDVDDAQTNLVRAQGILAKARRDYLVSLVLLEWVKGTISPPAPDQLISKTQ